MFYEEIVCAYLFIISKYGYPPPAEKTIQYLEEMFKLGFQSIELEGIREKHLLQVYDIKAKIKEKLDELNIKVPYFCAVLPGLTSIDKNEREKNLELFRKGCEIADLLGSLGILDNAPLPPYIFPKEIPIVRHYDKEVLATAALPEDISWDRFWEYTIETFREACDIAAEYNLTYQMHPSVGVLAANTKDFLYFYESVKRDNLRFNLDTANQFFMKDEPSESLRILSGYVDYIHLSDNRGSKVQHLKPEDGKISWNKFFETLDEIGFKGHIGLDIGGEESKVENIESVYVSAANWLEEKWFIKK